MPDHYFWRMAPNVFFWVAILIAAGSVAVGVTRNRRFRRKERLHQQMAEQLGLKVAYLNEKDFNLFGNYQDYALRLEAVELRPDRADSQPLTVLKASIPMVNPNRKALRVVRENDAYPRLNRHLSLDRPISLDHHIAPWLQLTTNDVMFSGIILSEDVKISLFEVFNQFEVALLSLYDEELAFFAPLFLTNEAGLKKWQRAVDLLVEIKDELN